MLGDAAAGGFMSDGVKKRLFFALKKPKLFLFFFSQQMLSLNI